MVSHGLLSRGEFPNFVDERNPGSVMEDERNPGSGYDDDDGQDGDGGDGSAGLYLDLDDTINDDETPIDLNTTLPPKEFKAYLSHRSAK